MLDEYILPHNFTLVTLSSQTSALQDFRGKTAVVHKLLCEEKQWVLSILNSVSSRSSSIHHLEARINPIYPQTESTIRSHIPSSTQN